MFKGIIFDFNGTLFDDSAIHYKIWEEIYLSITGGDYKEFSKNLIGAHNENLIKAMYQEINHKISDEEINRLSKEKEAKYRQYAIDNNLCRLIKGADRLLDEIKNHHIPVNICSASIKDNIDFFFKEFKVGRWFDYQNVIYDDGNKSDKYPMYIEAANRINCDIKDCLVFEDSSYGANAAIKAGAKVILIDRKKNKVLEDGIIQIVYDFDEVDRELIFK